MSSPAVHLVLAGGVTGGHVYPGVAVVESLRAQLPELRVTLIGTGRSWEREAAAANRIDYLAVPSRPLGKTPGRLLGCLKDNLTGYLKAARFLHRERVTAVLGLGGYASVPTATAAIRLDIPLVLVEANTVPGKATRWFARAASHVCVAFESAAAPLPRRASILVTGTPVRAGFTVTPVPRPLGYLSRQRIVAGVRSFAGDTDTPAPHQAPRRLVVLGGSQGATSLNETVPAALARLAPQLDNWRITHIAGPQGVAATRRCYAIAGVPAQVVPFVADMPRLLLSADAAISRAGGTTLAELAAAGVPAVLCPFPFAADDHQRQNALAMQAAGGCLVVDQREAGPELPRRLAEAVARLLDDAERPVLARAMRSQARPDAAYRVARALEALIAARAGSPR